MVVRIEVIDGDVFAALIKAGSAVVGAALGLVFQPPKTRNEAFQRAVFSTVFGFVGADPVRIEYLKWPDTMPNWIASVVLVALVSWWLFGAVVRIIGIWKPK